jgi:hypothetical protein
MKESKWATLKILGFRAKKTDVAEINKISIENEK